MNIIVFSDGTGQEGGKGHNTNVYKLFKMAGEPSGDQISFYDQGLGSDFRKISGNLFGFGISKNILECYQFIAKNFQPGDKIFLFGFSRGAATVRSLSGLIELIGIIPNADLKLLKKAYRIYKIKDREKQLTRAVRFVKNNHSVRADIHFLGVWDTVSALGVPFKSLDVVVDRIPAFRHKFHNYRLSKIVKNAFQALSIDDERLVFHPLLWEPEILDHQHMRQVWFCGVHTDVGGGYKEHDLSDIPLEWMMHRAKSCGLKLSGKDQVKIRASFISTLHFLFFLTMKHTKGKKNIKIKHKKCKL